MSRSHLPKQLNLSCEFFRQRGRERCMQTDKKTDGEGGPYLMLVLSPVSGSTALTRPTVQAGGQFSDTSSR